MSDNSTASRAVGVAGTAVTAANGVGTGIAVYGASASSIMSATAGTTGASFATLFGAAGTSGAAATSSGMATLGGLIGGGMATGAVIATAAPVAIVAAGLWGITKLVSSQSSATPAQRPSDKSKAHDACRDGQLRSMPSTAGEQNRVTEEEHEASSTPNTTTVRLLAIEVGIPASRILRRFKAAGVVLENEDSLVSNADKLRLLRHLRSLESEKEQ